MGEGVRLYTSLQTKNKQAVWTSKIIVKKEKSAIKLKNLAFYIWEDASLWAHWIHFFHMHLSYLGQILFLVHLGRWLLLVSPQLLSSHLAGLVASAGSRALCSILGSPHSPLDARNHCDVSCPLVWQEIFSFLTCRSDEATVAKRRWLLFLQKITHKCAQKHTHTLIKKAHSQKSMSNS